LFRQLGQSRDHILPPVSRVQSSNTAKHPQPELPEKPEEPTEPEESEQPEE